jgi:hypothetical protein
MGDIKLDGVGEVAFEGGFALNEPAGDVKKRCRAMAGDGEGGVVEGVRLDEGPIQVDAEHRRRGDVECGVRDGQKVSFLTSKPMTGRG